MTTVATRQQQIRTTIRARLDRLRWSPFHTRLVLGLGTAWILDGLEITIASSVTSKLTQANTISVLACWLTRIAVGWRGLRDGTPTSSAGSALWPKAKHPTACRPHSPQTPTTTSPS